MFILKCPCGNELYCSNEESRTAWQCDVCGQWLDMFGFPADKPVGEALGYFPRDAADSEATQPAAGGQVAEASSEGSWMERMGRTVSPVFAPMHFDWRMSVGILSGVGAKELVVSTLAVMYATSDSDDEEATEAGSRKETSGRPQRGNFSAIGFSN